MIRTQVYLTRQELDMIQNLANKTGKTRSKIIRQILDSFFESLDSNNLAKEGYFGKGSIYENKQ